MILVVSGSRADLGLLEWPVKVLGEHFETLTYKIWGDSFPEAFRLPVEPDLLLVLGDRFEILSAVTSAHLKRIPVAHLCGGDVTEGSYDDAMRDCISRMATIHFVTSTSAMARLTHMGMKNVHLVGNPGLDYIRHADWKKERPYPEPYVVVSYQAETLDGTNEIDKALEAIAGRKAVILMPNPDRGSAEIREAIRKYCDSHEGAMWAEWVAHDEFLNLIYHCEEFIGNSSSMLYEAPELGVKTRMIGKRQRGRTIPWGDGYASQRILKILKYGSL